MKLNYNFSFTNLLAAVQVKLLLGLVGNGDGVHGASQLVDADVPAPRWDGHHLLVAWKGKACLHKWDRK